MLNCPSPNFFKKHPIKLVDCKKRLFINLLKKVAIFTFTLILMTNNIILGKVRILKNFLLMVGYLPTI